MSKIKYMLVVFIGFICFIDFVSANSISIKSNYNTITRGNSVTITATINSDAPIVSIEGTMTCKGAGVSSGVDLNFDDLSNSLYSKSYTITAKTSSTGTLTCTTTGVRITNMSSGSWHNLSNQSINVTVKEPATVPQKTYSSNNYLKSLEVDGYTITPEFSKEVLEYSLEVPNETNKVSIKASTEDSKSTLSGTGEKELTEGNNKIEIKVTAENGNERIYTINITVKELDPIEITINGEKYTIIRKEGILEAPEHYEKSSIKILDNDVLCYKNIVTDNILVGLKDSSGEAKFYSYDEKENSYKEYHGYKIGGVNLNILDMPQDMIPSGYTKINFTYNEDEIAGYQLLRENTTYADDGTVKESDFYLIYAENEVTGEKGLYVYDKLENTIQRYNDSLILSYKSRGDSYLICLIVAIILLVISLVALTVVLIRKKKHKNRFA